MNELVVMMVLVVIMIFVVVIVVVFVFVMVIVIVFVFVMIIVIVFVVVMMRFVIWGFWSVYIFVVFWIVVGGGYDDGFVGEVDFVWRIDVDDFDGYFVFFVVDIGDVVDLVGGKFVDVDEVVCVWKDFYEIVVWFDVVNLIGVDFVDFGYFGDLFDYCDGGFGGCCVGWSDDDFVVVFDFDLIVCFFGDWVDCFVVWFDDVVNFVVGNFECCEVWCEVWNVFVWCLDCCFYGIENVKMFGFCLFECLVYDFVGDIGDFDVYL